MEFCCFISFNKSLNSKQKDPHTLKSNAHCDKGRHIYMVNTYLVFSFNTESKTQSLPFKLV